MSERVSAIRNLGPKSDEMFAKAGIHTAEELRALGADAAYARLIAAGTRPHFISYYALVMGLQGRPWNDCRGEEKSALRERFDALKAETDHAGGALPSHLAQMLDRMGVRRT